MSQHEKRVEHMAQRKAAGLNHREIGEEFNMSRSHAGNLLRAHAKKSKEKECS